MRSVELLILALAPASAACVDKLSEEGLACPCSGERVCCFATCVTDQAACSVQATLGVSGGVLAAPDGTELEVPFGALSEDTLLTLRAAPDLALPDGILALGAAVSVEPAGLTFAEPAVLRLPYDASRLPDGVDPTDVVIHAALTGTRAFRRVGTEVDAVRMQAEIIELGVFAPATSRVCGLDASRSQDNCGEAELAIGGSVYRTECGPGADGITTCRCLQDGEVVHSVEAPCPTVSTYVREIYRYECGFPCPEPAPRPDAGPDAPDAAVSAPDAGPDAASSPAG